MKILVTVKHVVDVQQMLTTKDEKVNFEVANFGLNAWDQNAIEAAMQIKESSAAEIDVVTIGGKAASAAIRKALSMGVDKGIHILYELEGKDAHIFAIILKKIVIRNHYDLILMGKQAQDSDAGLTGIILAELAGFPWVSNVNKIEIANGKLKLQRIGDDGTELIETSLPAVITVSDSINEPRFASMKNIMQAKKKLIETYIPSDFGLAEKELDNSVRTELIGSFMPPTRKAGKKFEGDPNETVSYVVQLLQKEAGVF